MSSFCHYLFLIPDIVQVPKSDEQYENMNEKDTSSEQLEDLYLIPVV